MTSNDIFCGYKAKLSHKYLKQFNFHIYHTYTKQMSFHNIHSRIELKTKI